MEHLDIVLNDQAKFDAAVHGDGQLPSLPEGGDLALITKDGVTSSGRALACLTFTVTLPDGSRARAQHVTTVRLLTMMLAALRGRYGDEGRSSGLTS